MRFFRTRLHVYVSLVFLTCLLTTIIVILILPRERVTEANFDKIKLGMSLADVQRLLGPPEIELVDSGLGKGLEVKRQLWSSPEITIILISDTAGRVACRCRGDGQERASMFETFLRKAAELLHVPFRPAKVAVAN